MILSNGNNIQIGKKDKKISNGSKHVKMIEYNNKCNLRYIYYVNEKQTRIQSFFVENIRDESRRFNGISSHEKVILFNNKRKLIDVRSVI